MRTKRELVIHMTRQVSKLVLVFDKHSHLILSTLSTQLHKEGNIELFNYQETDFQYQKLTNTASSCLLRWTNIK